MDRRKALIAANLVMWMAQGLYTVSPIDLIPDIIPLIGLMDDGLGLVVTIAFTVYTVTVVRRQGLEGVIGKERGDALDPEVIDGAYKRDPLAEYEPVSVEELEALSFATSGD